MNGKDVVRMVAGSVAIYVVVAACSSSSNGVVALDGGKGGGSHDAHGMADVKGMADAVTHPVGDAKADETMGGSRLKAQHYTGTDGSSQFAGFYDSMLSVACAFSVATDGKTHCMPSGDKVAVAEGAYSDSGCTTAIATATDACGTPTYVVQGIGSAGCPNTPEIQAFQVGSAYTGTVYGGTPSSCKALSAGATSGYAFYSLGSKVAASAFVEATLQTD